MFRIPCPQCGKRLKVKDPAFIGRKAKCPQCSHRFVLTLPTDEIEEVQLTLAEPPPAAAPKPTSLKTGTSARWVPDEPIAAPDEATTVVPEPREPHNAEPAAFDFSESAPTSRMDELRSRRRKRNRTGWIVGALGAVVIGGVAIGAWMAAGQGTPETSKPVVKKNEQWQKETAALRQQAVDVASVSPTRGEAIDLRYIPDGAQMVFHLRPSALWSKEESMRELIFALGPRFGKWLSEQVTLLSGFQPSEIEQLTVAVGLGPRDSEPEVSAIVRLHEAQKRSVMIRQRFRGQRDLNLQADIYVGEKLAWLLVDEKTFAVGPAELAADMVSAAQSAAEPCDDLRALIAKTDRDRHFTALIDRSALEIHTDTLFSAQLRPAIVQFTDWLGGDIDSAAISLHFGEEKLFMETLLRSGTGTTPAKLNRAVRSRLDELPADILKMARFMRPRRRGQRRIIARFPAMTKALAAATETGIGDRFVQLTTLLPERAIPNLIVGTVLTWDESTRTDFTREVKSPGKPKTALPATLGGRLARPIELEFKDTPLQEAFGFLGEEIGVTFSMDGDAIKLAGLTKNMKQTINLGKVPAHKILEALLAQRPPLALVADESTMSFKVTTPPAAEAAGEKTYQLPK